MVKEIKIESVQPLSFKDGQAVEWVQGQLLHDTELGVQPAKVSWLSTASVSGLSTIRMDSMQADSLYVIDGPAHSEREIFGSDHNGGLMFFGQDMKKIMELLDKEIKDSTARMSAKDKEYNPLCTVQWDFEDGNSLVLFYCHTQYLNDYGQQLRAPNILKTEFGAGVDDVKLNEILGQELLGILKKVKMPQEEDADYGDPGIDFFSVNDRDLSKKHHKLVIDAGYHVFCSLMQWHQEGSEDETDSSNIIVAQKLHKYREIQSLSMPLADEETRLLYQKDGSNKEYTIGFKEEGGHFFVSVRYGRVGGKMTDDVVLDTLSKEEAQQMYLDIVSDKMYKGYDKDSGLIKAPKP